MRLLETTAMTKRKKMHLLWDIKRGKTGLNLCLQVAKFPKAYHLQNQGLPMEHF